MKMFALFLACTMALLTIPPVASAQDAAQGWLSVQALAPGTALIVETKNGDILKGKLNGAPATTLSLTVEGNTLDLGQSTIRRIYRAKGWSRTKTALLGAGIGGAAGVGIGIGVAAADDNSIGANFAPLSFGFVGVVAGAVVGAVSGGKRKGRLLYEAK